MFEFTNEILFFSSFFFFVFFFFFSQTGRAHLILVTLTPGKPGGAIGVITLEGKLLTAAPCFFFLFFSKSKFK